MAAEKREGRKLVYIYQHFPKRNEIKRVKTLDPGFVQLRNNAITYVQRIGRHLMIISLALDEPSIHIFDRSF